MIDVYFNDAARAKAALSFIPADDRELWVRIGMALKAGLGENGFELFDRWSQSAPSYKKEAARAVWKSIKPGGIRFATLFHEAQRCGFDRCQHRMALTPPLNAGRHCAKRERSAEVERKLAAKQCAAAKRAVDIWTKAELASDTHPYLALKGVKAHGLRCYRGQLTIGNMACDGALIIPAYDAHGVLTTLAFINKDGEKRFLSGGKKSGSFHWIGEPVSNLLCIAEGYATGASVYEATRYPVAVAFDAGNLLAVANTLKLKFPDAQFVICADNDFETPGNPGATKAKLAAHQVGARLAMPEKLG
ncbi:DNA primase, phage-associated [Mycoavidus cysteinexigens]|uniref:DNA primase, phage-associated n=1 Tax=Mycoavidus cysteinexigens TaxID=1553431 RepID=A0A2Z6ESA9_9BURK|nr:PriCT-2 domain-containing protein [Mycoavidus cysteinexigens]BBE08293.1 DNA primase, phage-associated [Mycoavidus cysteinexigens]GAM53003.1 DNA primase [bacterium endosymbiont of Mortierella elongata FMR23-6]GLR00799.1 hypothetical protein GCM10007934_06110 [Mycoavidus cysteinexigens]